MRALLLLAGLLAASVPAGAGGAATFTLSDLQYDAWVGPTDALPARHHVQYGGAIQNDGPEAVLYLKVTGTFAPGLPFSATTAQTVPIHAPTGTSAFSFEGTNLPWPYVCATLVASPSNTAPPVSNGACSYAQDVAVLP